MNLTPAFSEAIRRLKRIRDVVSSEPEEAWRATFDLVISSERRWEALVHSFSSVAVLIGLMGTVMGFLGLGIQLGPAAAQKLAAQLPKLFSATFFGIIGSALILGIGLPILRNAIDSWANAVEDVGRLVLLPALPRPPIRIPSRIQEVIISELTNRLDTVARAWHDSLAGPANSLQNLVSSSNSSIQEIHRALQDVKISAQDLSDFAASARQIKAASAAMAKSSAAHASAGAQFTSVAVNFEKTLRGLSDAVQDSTGRLGLLDQTMGLAGNELRSQGETVTKGVAGMAIEFKGLSNVVTDRMKQEAQVAREAWDAVTAIHGQLSALKSVEQALSANADRMSLAAGALKSAADDTLRELPNAVSRDLSGALKRLEQQHQLLLDEVKEQLTKWAGGTTEAAGKLGAASGQIAAAAKDFASNVEASAASLDAAQQKILEKTGDLTVATSTFTDVAQQSLREIPDHLDKALREAIEHWQVEQGASLAGLARQLIEAISVSNEGVRALHLAVGKVAHTGNGQAILDKGTEEFTESPSSRSPLLSGDASDVPPDTDRNRVEAKIAEPPLALEPSTAEAKHKQLAERLNQIERVEPETTRNISPEFPLHEEKNTEGTRLEKPDNCRAASRPESTGSDLRYQQPTLHSRKWWRFWT